MVIGSISVYKVTMLETVYMWFNVTTVKSLGTPVDLSTASQKSQIQHVSSVQVITHQETVETRGIRKLKKSNVQTALRVEIMQRGTLP